MSLEEKSKRESIGFPQNQKYIFRTGFEGGYKECQNDLIDFLKANQKASVQQIIDYLEGIK